MHTAACRLILLLSFDDAKPRREHFGRARAIGSTPQATRQLDARKPSAGRAQAESRQRAELARATRHPRVMAARERRLRACCFAPACDPSRRALAPHSTLDGRFAAATASARAQTRQAREALRVQPRDERPTLAAQTSRSEASRTSTAQSHRSRATSTRAAQMCSSHTSHTPCERKRCTRELPTRVAHASCPRECVRRGRAVARIAPWAYERRALQAGTTRLVGEGDARQDGVDVPAQRSRSACGTRSRSALDSRFIACGDG
eukprot:6187772-Pleurochrysis_carterae.AAC.2